MAEAIHEVLPGVWHWTARHPSAGLESGSHYLAAEGILIDPIAPAEGLEWFEGKEIGEILLLRCAVELVAHGQLPSFSFERFGLGIHEGPTSKRH